MSAGVWQEGALPAKKKNEAMQVIKQAKKGSRLAKELPAREGIAGMQVIKQAKRDPWLVKVLPAREGIAGMQVIKQAKRGYGWRRSYLHEKDLEECR